MGEQLVIRAGDRVGAPPVALSTSLANSVRAFLPMGGGLSLADWQIRHHAILALLWLQVPVVIAFALTSIHGVGHGLAEAGAIALFALLASWPARGRRFREVAASLGLVTTSAALVHLSGGYVELHFHFFVVVALIALYQDWPPFLVAIGYVLFHHGLVGTIVPTAVYNHPAAWEHPWRWAAIHGGFVLATAGASVAAWRFSEAEQRRRLAEEERSDRWQVAQLAVTRVLAEAESLAAAMEHLLPTLCQTLSWEWGAVWEVDEDERGLHRAAAWQMPGVDVSVFKEASRDRRVVRGEGLKGVAWQSSEPLWVPDVATDQRNIDRQSALASGLHSAAFVPIVSQERTLGVIELISRERREFDPALMAMLGGLGSQTGQFVQRRREQERARAELERRVAQRTADLVAANKELESFAYSVSHDLRAPLRAIDGFARIIEDDHEAELTAETRRLLQRVRTNAELMGEFVDGLLTFSRLGRQPLQLRHVDVARIVEQVLEDLTTEQEGRRVEIVVGDLPQCEADPNLLRQVFANLLGNAHKYSSERDPSLIEIGGYVSDDARETVYWVRDNGVGFDMAYAAKLFEVFQRLHRAEDYEGIGIGLALAQRIVHRHGGRIWAESAVDQGAMFAFAIPLVPDVPEAPRMNEQSPAIRTGVTV